MRKTILLWFARLLTLLYQKISPKSLNQVRCSSRSVIENENPTTALNTTSLKRFLPSINTIDRQEKFTYAYEDWRSSHERAFYWNPLGFRKQMFGFFSDRVVCIEYLISMLLLSGTWIVLHSLVVFPFDIRCYHLKNTFRRTIVHFYFQGKMLW